MPDHLKRSHDPEKLKVYCENCRFLTKLITKEELYTVERTFTCIASENKGSWFNKDGYARHPREINADNDCLWFEERE